MLDICATTLPSAKAYLQLRQYRRFVGCERDLSCIQDMLLSFMNMYAKQALSLQSDKFVSKEAVEASKVFLKAMTALESGRKVDSWTVPAGLVHVLTFHVHIMHILYNAYKD